MTRRLERAVRVPAPGAPGSFALSGFLALPWADALSLLSRCPGCCPFFTVPDLLSARRDDGTRCCGRRLHACCRGVHAGVDLLQCVAQLAGAAFQVLLQP